MQRRHSGTRAPIAKNALDTSPRRIAGSDWMLFLDSASSNVCHQSREVYCSAPPFVWHTESGECMIHKSDFLSSGRVLVAEKTGRGLRVDKWCEILQAVKRAVKSF